MGVVFFLVFADAARGSVALPDAASGSGSEVRQAYGNSALSGSLSLTAGLREDNLDWSIAGNSSGTNPNILSLLEWSDVESYQVRLAGWIMAGPYFYLRGHAGAASIKSGTLQDSDYDGDNQTEEFSRSISQTNDDSLYDLSVGLGVPIQIPGTGLIVAPMFGVSAHYQNFRITDGRQVFTWPGGPEIGPIEGLDSSYESKWVGPWIGCDLRYRSPRQRRRMELGLSLELHRVDFSAEADWNLRTDMQHPVSFRQDAEGAGFIIEGDWSMNLTGSWDLEAVLSYSTWSTDRGIDRVYFSNGSVGTTRLNEVNWDSRSAMIGVCYRF